MTHAQFEEMVAGLLAIAQTGFLERGIIGFEAGTDFGAAKWWDNIGSFPDDESLVLATVPLAREDSAELEAECRHRLEAGIKDARAAMERRLRLAPDKGYVATTIEALKVA